jgi:parvulin-like peptidyl-prolyl isomerase
MRRVLPWLAVVGVFVLTGCRAPGPDASVKPDSQSTQPTDRKSAEKAGQPLAYINGEAVTEPQLFTPLLEAAGGRVLSEIVLNRMVDRRLKQRGLDLTPKQIEREKQLVQQSLASDENQSVLLLKQMRRRAGLGQQRFEAMLRRNAGLRELVQDEVQVTDLAIRQAYKRQYGPRYEGRILVVPTAQQARQFRSKIRDGASFATLAARHSTDASAAQGGLLSPISPADPSYPQVIRETLAKLEPGQVSEVIALEAGYALLTLERKIAGQSVKLADVRGELKTAVRRRAERLKMRSLAQSLLSQANVVVLDKTLGDRWQQHKQQLLQSEQ